MTRFVLFCATLVLMAAGSASFAGFDLGPTSLLDSSIVIGPADSAQLYHDITFCPDNDTFLALWSDTREETPTTSTQQGSHLTARCWIRSEFS